MEIIVAGPFLRADRPRHIAARVRMTQVVPDEASGGNIAQQKKAAWLPRRPFLSYDGATFSRAISEPLHRGPISQPYPDRGPLLIRDSRELEPEPYAMVSHLRKMG